MSRLFPAFPTKNFFFVFFFLVVKSQKRKKEERPLSVSFFVCVSYLGFQILEERERERGLLSLSLSFASLFVEEKKTKKKEQNFSQKHRKGSRVKVLTFKYTHKHNTIIMFSLTQTAAAQSVRVTAPKRDVSRRCVFVCAPPFSPPPPRSFFSSSFFFRMHARGCFGKKMRSHSYLDR